MNTEYDHSSLLVLFSKISERGANLETDITLLLTTGNNINTVENMHIIFKNNYI